MKISKKSINCSFTGEPDPMGISESSLRDAKKAKTWQEVYKLFDEIVDKYMPDAEKIEKEVYNLYSKNKGLKQYKEAYDHWMDEADLSIENNEEDEIESSVDIDEETEDPKWICLDIKHVRDSDGTLTDYALYTNKDEDKYICMFGDADIYAPDDMYADAEFDTEEEALEWFENYVGPGDEDDDIYSSEETNDGEDNDDLDHPDQELDSSDGYSVPNWEEVASKQVLDSDGFLTDYTMYTDGETYICMFGDKEIYKPDAGYADYETEDEKNAWDWFNTYEGFADDFESDEDYDIYSSQEVDDGEDDLDHPDQEFDSADTSINSSKLPAVYKLISIPKGTVGVDFGGGRFDNAVEYIRDLGSKLCVYDPYNRTAQHNREMLKTLKANGGADWAVNSNVLNVIKEPEARQSVLRNISKITKSGSPIYITVYEGRGDSKEGPTKSGYQLNRKTQDYLEEIQEVFPDAKRKGKLIIAHNIQSASSSTNFNSSEVIRPIDELNDVTDQLRDDLIQKLVDVMAGPNFGFPRNDVLDYSRVDIRFDDDENRIEVEVGAEVSYDGLMQIAQELDPIIQSYDEYAYFDAEDAGLLIAVIPYESLRKNMNVNSAVDVPEPSLDPPEYDDPDEGEETVEVECDINQLEITVEEDGSWQYQRDNFLDEMLTSEDELTSEEYDVYIRDRNGLIEDFDSIVEPNIPGVPGTYLISCHVKMVYDVTGVEIVREYQGKDEDGYPIVDEDYYTVSADVDFKRNESYITNFYSEEI